eukprot:scaffold652_cov260-Pinguiococcus_pyrenoidosus.AAC.1
MPARRAREYLLRARKRRATRCIRQACSSRMDLSGFAPPSAGRSILRPGEEAFFGGGLSRFLRHLSIPCAARIAGRMCRSGMPRWSLTERTCSSTLLCSQWPAAAGYRPRPRTPRS